MDRWTNKPVSELRELMDQWTDKPVSELREMIDRWTNKSNSTRVFNKQQ